MRYSRSNRATRGRAVRLTVQALLGLVLLVLTAPLAAAGSVVATEPLDRQELDAAPGWVTLAFDTDVDPGSAKVLVQDAQGRNHTVGQLIVEGTNVTTQLEDGLQRGTYTVRYRVVTTGEPFGGAYQFAYGTGAFTDLPDRSWSGTDAEPPALSNDDPNATTSAPPPSPRPRESEPGVEVSKGTGGTGSTPEPTGPATSPDPSGPPTVDPTGAATSPTAAASPSPTTAQSPSGASGGGSGPGTAAVVVGVVVLAAAVGALVWWRRRGGTPSAE